jgi:hypothetical protein
MPVSVSPANEIGAFAVPLIAAPWRFAYGPTRYPLASLQFVGNADGVPMMLPDCTLVIVAPDRFVLVSVAFENVPLVRFAFERFALDRFAP